MGNQQTSSGETLSTQHQLKWRKGAEDKGNVQSFKNRRDLNISYRVWNPSSSPTAIVFVVHGLHEHGGRYSELAQVLTQERYTVVALDHIGHGLSDGERALIPDMDATINDVLQLIKETANSPAYSGLPLMFVNHSMGSMIGGNALIQLKADSPELAERVKAVVVSGALIKPGKDSASPLGKSWLYFLNNMGPVSRGLAKALAKSDPSGDAAPINTDKLSHDEESTKHLDEDDLHYTGWVKNLTAAQISQGILRLKKSLQEFDYPVLIIHGAEDTICLPESAQTWFRGVSSGVKELKMYDGLYHEIMNETLSERTKVFSDIAAFMAASLFLSLKDA